MSREAPREADRSRIGPLAACRVRPVFLVTDADLKMLLILHRKLKYIMDVAVVTGLLHGLRTAGCTAKDVVSIDPHYMVKMNSSMGGLCAGLE